jgi:hypothetical protein
MSNVGREGLTGSKIAQFNLKVAFSKVAHTISEKGG